MRYDPSKLRALRDNIDGYLAKEDAEEQQIYEALEQSITKSVTEALKPVVDDFGRHVDRLLQAQQDKED